MVLEMFKEEQDRRSYSKLAILGALGSISAFSFPFLKQKGFSEHRLLTVVCGNCGYTAKCKEFSNPKKRWKCLARTISKNFS